MPELEGHAQGEMHGVLPAGTSLGRYELISILGQGAFGVTYRARDVTLNQDVAIKEYLPAVIAVRKDRSTVVPRSPDHSEQFAWGRERFLEEARTLGRLDGTPAIVRAYDFLEANGTAYMVMALIEGETLHKRLMREQRLKSDAIERLLFPLLDGLEAVHAINFLHRDIKPANIMVDGEGQPTLIDFGASRAAMAERSTTLTAIFTPGYAAIEQFTSTNPGPWSDIYGLGATLYHAITGRIPPSAIDRMLHDKYEPLSELQPDGYDPALLMGIDKAMAFRTDDRPQSVVDWRHMLMSSSLDATRLGRKPSRLARAVSKTKRTRLTIGAPVLGTAAAAIATVLIGAGYLAFTANESSTVTTTTAALTLSAEQLELALAERRKADTLVAEKRRLEEEARQRAEADATAKRQADEELEKVRQARLKADQELAELNASIESRRQAAPDVRGQAATAAQRETEEAAQRKAEAEADALREAEEDAAKKAGADAEAKRQADQALAVAGAQRRQAEADAQAKAEVEATARRQASEEAQRRAEAEAASRRQADEAQAKAQAEREKAEAEAKIKADAKAEADKAAAAIARLKEEGEAAEGLLRLEQPARQRLQVALNSLGFDTRGNDGVFGPRSRDMIAGWQKKAGAPPTGFLTGAQRDQLLRAAAPAVARWDEEQKRIEEDKTRADPAKVAATASLAATSPAPASPAPPAAGQLANTGHDGTYAGDVLLHAGQSSMQRVFASVRLTNGQGSGSLTTRGCSPSQFLVTLSSTGNATGEGYLNCVVGVSGDGSPGMGGSATGAFKINGKIEGKSFVLAFQTAKGAFSVSLTRGGGASPSSTSPDGLWRGTYTCGEGGGQWSGPGGPFTIDLTLKLDGSTSSGGGSNPSIANGRTTNVEVSVSQKTVTVGRSWMGMNQHSQKSFLNGQLDGNTIRASGKENHTNRDCTLALTRVP